MRDEILERSRKYLLSYCAMMNPNYEVPDHIFELAKILHDVEAGITRRVIVTMPPRHGKSMLDSQYFPAWFMGRNPEKFVIIATYGQDLATDFGRKVRDQVQDPLFGLTFPGCKMNSDTTAAHRFTTTAGGEYYAVGFGGPVTGRGAHLFLIDDPIKGREEADSEVVRNKINEWYGAVAYTRMMPNASIVILMTRWHEEDLVGFVTKNHPHENWEIIDFPAILDEGTDQEEALWPERYPLEVLHTIKATLPFYDWSCLYQQNPVPKEGNIIREEWLSRGLPDKSEVAVYVVGIDPAISKKEKADETSMAVWAVGYGNPAPVFEIENRHGKFNFAEQVAIAEGINQEYKPMMFGIEGDRGGKILLEVLTSKGLPAVELPITGDKVMRTNSVLNYFTQGRVHVNCDKTRKQMLSFRGIDGDEDDLHDASINALRVVKAYTSDRYAKADERYKGMDPRSEMFWRNHFKDPAGGKDRGDHLINAL